MSIIVRITSADGKKVISKELPALPAHLKVPAGAHVDVLDKDTGERMSLGQYINAHADTDRKAEDGQIVNNKVSVETVQEWSVAQDWLDHMAVQGVSADSMGTMEGVPASEGWYEAGKHESENQIFGYSQNTLILGGLVGGGLVFGALELLDSGGTKDKIAPVAPTGIDLATDDDTGSSSTDNITSKTEGLTFSGTAEAGSKVELFSSETSLGTAVADASGKFTIDVDLAEGTHLITATATDNAGNVSEFANPLPVLIDTTAPAAPAALDLLAEDDSGSSSTDNITAKTTGLTITGTAAAGATVELFDGTTSLGSATADSTGAFKKDISLSQGSHNITAHATDAAGNVGEASEGLSITVDTTPPPQPSLLDLAAEDDTGSSNTDNITTKTSGLTISGRAEAGTVVELFDGSNSLGTTVVNSDGTFVKDISLDLGDHAITAKVSDIAGNASFSPTALEISIVATDTFASASFIDDTLHSTSSLLGSTSSFG